MKNQVLRIVGVIVFIGLVACAAQSASTGGKVALIRAQEVELLTINGTPLDPDSKAVLVVAGRNDLTFRWPIFEEDFKIPREYRLIMNAAPSEEYVVTPNPTSGFLCAWKSDREQGIDFTKHSGCVQHQPN